jgi:hypothetical protein
MISVDEVDDVIYLANGDVYAVVSDGYRRIADDAGDMVAFAAAHNAAVVAWEGDTTIGAVDNAGRLLWRSEAAGAIYNLAPVGETGAVFALVYEDLAMPGSLLLSTVPKAQSGATVLLGMGCLTSRSPAMPPK